MNIRIHLLYVLFLILPQHTSATGDSTLQLSLQEFFSVVRAYHPLAGQAAIRPLSAGAAVLGARGAFDPKLESELSEKQFDGSRYYSLFSAGVKIPVWYGLEFKGGYERNSGVNLNAENKLPINGLYYAGVAVNLGRGLLTDERRTMLKQAHIYKQASVEEQSKMLNSLLYEAGNAYWEWYAAHSRYGVYKTAIETAVQRFEAVKQMAALGDRPSVDTLEAGIQLQERRLSLQQSLLELRNAALHLSSFLWLEQQTPYNLPEDAVPTAPDIPMPMLLPANAAASAADSFLGLHPELRMKRYKLDAMSAENEWKREQLKPRLQVSYNPLFVPENNLPGMYVTDNYKLGLGFSMPLFLRKERGELRISNYKIREAELDLDYSNLHLLRQSETAFNELENTGAQFNLYSRTVEDYGKLFQAEKRIFEGGESSLFMINAREMSYILARIKLIDIYFKNRKAELSAAYSLGILGR